MGPPNVVGVCVNRLEWDGILKQNQRRRGSGDYRQPPASGCWRADKMDLRAARWPLLSQNERARLGDKSSSGQRGLVVVLAVVTIGG